MNDPINPSHYKHLPVEAIDIIMAAIAKAPSNESACLHWQVLKYLLRCWEKNGIEDLRKGKVYLDRLVASFDDLLAEASGAIETPDDEPSEETDQNDHPHDFKVGDAVISWQGREGIIEAIGIIEDFPITVRHSIREQVSYKLGGVKKKHDDHPVEPAPWTPKIGDKVVYTPDGSAWTVDRELKERADRDGKTYILESGTDVLRACLSRLAPNAPPKRHREPTKDDLKNGPIDCEVRNSDGEQWVWRILCGIADGSDRPFRVLNGRIMDSKAKWPQCRIEVAE